MYYVGTHVSSLKPYEPRREGTEPYRSLKQIMISDIILVSNSQEMYVHQHRVC